MPPVAAFARVREPPFAHGRDYRSFSALRRRGTAAEVATAVAWLALENTYMNGKILPVNGGL